MAKVRQLYAPLAVWAGGRGRRVRLVMPYHLNCAVYELLVSVARTANVPLADASTVGRRAAQTLATEIMRRPAMSMMDKSQRARLTVSESEALSLLAWMLSSPTTDDASHPLRPLIDSLHRLLT
jgi:hypothetical protein